MTVSPSQPVPSRVQRRAFQVLALVVRLLALASAIATLASPSLK